MPRGSERRPYCSVIVNAFNRREFFREAVNSVLAQTVPKETYEIILVTDFEVGQDFISEKGIKHVLSAERKIGARIAAAFDEACGELISILDDDDIWDRGRLEHVYSLFRHREELVYYHNNWTTIDDEGREISHPIHSMGRRKMEDIGAICFAPGELKYRSLRKLIKLSLDFNSSSITVRRRVLEENADKLRCVSLSADTFLFYASMKCREGIMCADSSKLTFYRIHEGNNSFKNGKARRQPFDADIYLIEEMFCDSGSSCILKSLEAHNSDLGLEWFWIEGSRNRHKMLGNILRRIRYVSLGDLDYSMLLFSFSLLYLILPSFTRKIYMHQYYSHHGSL